jgi:hypothetical protein
MERVDDFIEKRGGEIEALNALSKLLNTGLDRRVLSVLLELLEMGVNPESLVDGKHRMKYRHVESRRF